MISHRAKQAVAAAALMAVLATPTANADDRRHGASLIRDAEIEATLRALEQLDGGAFRFAQGQARISDP